MVKINSAYYNLNGKDKKYINRKAKKFTVYVVRSKENNDYFQESQPCISCEHLLKRVGFKKIIYSTFEGKIEKKKISELSTEHCSNAQRGVKEKSKSLYCL